MLDLVPVEWAVKISDEIRPMAGHVGYELVHLSSVSSFEYFKFLTEFYGSTVHSQIW